jgi:hypothetical protein
MWPRTVNWTAPRLVPLRALRPFFYQGMVVMTGQTIHVSIETANELLALRDRVALGATPPGLQVRTRNLVEWSETKSRDTAHNWLTSGVLRGHDE